MSCSEDEVNILDSLISFEKRPDDSRASTIEKEEGYIEADLMAQECIKRGMKQSQFIIEPKALNSRENIMYSLQLIPSESNNVLIISGGFQGIRSYLYAQKELQKMMRSDGKQRTIFVIDSDCNYGRRNGFDHPIYQKRLQEKTIYEIPRLIQYLQAGHL